MASFLKNYVTGGAASQGEALKKWRNKSLSLLGQEEEQQRQQLAERERILTRGIGELGEGYDKAIGNVALGGVLAKESMTGALNTALGGVKQSLASRGLTGSSLMDLGTLGAAKSYGSALGGIQSETQSKLAGLNIGKGQALMQAKGGLSNFLGEKGATLQDVAQSKQNFLDSYYGMKMQGVGSKSMGFMGGPLGGKLNDFFGSGGAQFGTTNFKFDPMAFLSFL